MSDPSIVAGLATAGLMTGSAISTSGTGVIARAAMLRISISVTLQRIVGLLRSFQRRVMKLAVNCLTMPGNGVVECIGQRRKQDSGKSKRPEGLSDRFVKWSICASGIVPGGLAGGGEREADGREQRPAAGGASTSSSGIPADIAGIGIDGSGERLANTGFGHTGFGEDTDRIGAQFLRELRIVFCLLRNGGETGACIIGEFEIGHGIVPLELNGAGLEFEQLVVESR
jgi:hypothetical protein